MLSARATPGVLMPLATVTWNSKKALPDVTIQILLKMGEICGFNSF